MKLIIIIIYQKTRKLTREYIKIYNDNYKLIQMINNKLSPTQFAQEAAAEVLTIKQIIKKLLIEIIFE